MSEENEKKGCCGKHQGSKEHGCCGGHHEHNHDHEHHHGCGHDHDHEHEHVHTVSLELENGEELECPILEIFEIDGKEYIALLHPEDEVALLYGFVEHEDESIELTEIVSDEEYEAVSEAFMSLMEDDEEDEE